MKTLFKPLLVALLASLVLPAVADDQKPHVVLVCGTTHYSPELTMPVFAEELERFGFKTTVVVGEGDPEKKTKNVLPGLEVLAEADLVIFFMRFLKMPAEEFQPIKDYLESGKPLIGLRTANHSFKYPADHPLHEWNDGFGRRAMAGPYVVHQGGTTDISVLPTAGKHPILANVEKTEWVSPGTLYLTRLEPGVEPLVIGKGLGRDRLLTRDWGSIMVNESEADIVAWAWENEWGGKVFGTSFGHPGDFAEESHNRMLVNSVHWCLDMVVPPADAEITTWQIERADKKKKK